MPKVYFAKTIETILNQLDLDKLGDKVGIKVHFGEKGCNTYLNPELARKVYEKITAAGKSAALVECNVLYKGSRVNSTDHRRTALEHGFTDMPIDFLDGEDGGEFIELEGCKVGKGIERYDSFLVLSHFKGHMAAGFGGAIKNLGMGLGSRAGKLHMHSNIHPSISENCIGCGTCVENCNAEAIVLEQGKARIIDEKCEGCAMCIAVCAPHAINIPWAGRTSEDLQEKIAEYTAAILKFRPKALFINVLENITPHCDCMGMEQTPFMDNVGFLYSNDIVAIDKASIDLADKASLGAFRKINEVDKDKQVEFAASLGLGQDEYELIEL